MEDPMTDILPKEGRDGHSRAADRAARALGEAPHPGEPGACRGGQEASRQRPEPHRRQDHGLAGSMMFVYLHILWFGSWIGFGVESYPYGLLTMIVSLEAIFLSTFVMISQNRADAKRQV